MKRLVYELLILFKVFDLEEIVGLVLYNLIIGFLNLLVLLIMWFLKENILNRDLKEWFKNFWDDWIFLVGNLKCLFVRFFFLWMMKKNFKIFGKWMYNILFFKGMFE